MYAAAPQGWSRLRVDSYFMRDRQPRGMSATVAFIVIAICVLAVFAVGAAGWWMALATLSEEDHDEAEPQNGGRAV